MTGILTRAKRNLNEVLIHVYLMASVVKFCLCVYWPLEFRSFENCLFILLLVCQLGCFISSYLILSPYEFENWSFHIYEELCRNFGGHCIEPVDLFW